MLFAAEGLGLTAEPTRCESSVTLPVTERIANIDAYEMPAGWVSGLGLSVQSRTYRQFSLWCSK